MIHEREPALIHGQLSLPSCWPFMGEKLSQRLPEGVLINILELPHSKWAPGARRLPVPWNILSGNLVWAGIHRILPSRIIGRGRRTEYSLVPNNLQSTTENGSARHRWFQRHLLQIREHCHPNLTFCEIPTSRVRGFVAHCKTVQFVRRENHIHPVSRGGMTSEIV